LLVIIVKLAVNEVAQDTQHNQTACMPFSCHTTYTMMIIWLQKILF